jgi:hypothetical protein
MVRIPSEERRPVMLDFNKMSITEIAAVNRQVETISTIQGLNAAALLLNGLAKADKDKAGTALDGVSAIASAISYIAQVNQIIEDNSSLTKS